MGYKPQLLPTNEMAAIHIQEAMRLLGFNAASDPSTEATPLRVAKYWESCFAGIGATPDFKFTTFPSKGMSELVTVKDIEFSSLCEHHCLPFFGAAHIGYIPGDRIVGLSKIPRLVDFCALKPQTQEYLTQEIGQYLVQELRPSFVGVLLEASHTCVACRGARKIGSTTVTSWFQSVWPSDVLETTKREFLHLVH